MPEALLFHHAQGPTSGFVAFADELRGGGHVVHAPEGGLDADAAALLSRRVLELLASR